MKGVLVLMCDLLMGPFEYLSSVRGFCVRNRRIIVGFEVRASDTFVIN